MIESLKVRTTNLEGLGTGVVARCTVHFANGLIVQNVLITESATGLDVQKKDGILFRTLADRKEFNRNILATYVANTTAA